MDNVYCGGPVNVYRNLDLVSFSSLFFISFTWCGHLVVSASSFAFQFTVQLHLSLAQNEKEKNFLYNS